MKRIILSFSVCFLLSAGQQAAAQKSDVRAPVDSYVCIDSTYLDCAERTVGDLKDLLGSRIRIVPAPVNKLEVRINLDVAKSIDEKVACADVLVAYPRRIDLAYRFKVIFLSLEYLLQLREAARRLEVALVACQNLVDRYQAQSKLLEIQDMYAIANDEFQLVQTEWQVRSIAVGEMTDHAWCWANYVRMSPVPDKKAAEDCIKAKTIPNWGEGFETQDGRTWLRVHDRMAHLKLASLQHAKALRQFARETLEAESVRQGKELSLALEGSLSDMFRILFAMNTMVVTSSKKETKFVSHGSYVTRGTVVLRLQ